MKLVQKIMAPVGLLIKVDSTPVDCIFYLLIPEPLSREERSPRLYGFLKELLQTFTERNICWGPPGIQGSAIYRCEWTGAKYHLLWSCKSECLAELKKHPFGWAMQVVIKYTTALLTQFEMPLYASIFPDSQHLHNFHFISLFSMCNICMLNFSVMKIHKLVELAYLNSKHTQ